MDKSLLDLYTDYLISSFGQVTATGLSQLLDGKVSHDQVTRFLSSSAKTSADLWRVVKPLVRQVESDDAVLIIDDSIEEKPYTDENDLICWHYDHSQERNVKGINFLTALYCPGELALPVAFDLLTKTEAYVEAKTGKAKRRSAVTKKARYRLLLQRCAQNQLRFQYVLNDVWYAAAENMIFIVESLKKHFVMPLKQNASLEKSPTRTVTTQRNHLYASLCAYIKLENLKMKTGLNQFALKSKIYMSAVQAAYAALGKLKPQPLAA